MKHVPVVRPVQLVLAAALAFASVVEMSHFRFYQKRKNYFRMACTGAAAVAPLYMASECLTGDWPEWSRP